MSLLVKILNKKWKIARTLKRWFEKESRPAEIIIIDNVENFNNKGVENLELCGN